MQMNRLLFFYLLILLIFLINTRTESQDYFGKIRGPFASDVQSLIVTPNNTLLAGTWGNGVYKSTDGINWTPMNNGLSDGFIDELALDRNGTILAAAFGKGVFKYNASSDLWESISTGITNSDIKALAVNNTNNDYYCGTYGAGVFRSSNAGASWTSASAGLMYRDINAMIVSRNGYIIAGTNGGGIFRSSNSGGNWNKTSTGLRSYFVNQFTMTRLGYIYAATNGGGVVYSGTEGLAWVDLDTTNLTDMNMTSIALTRNEDLVLCNRWAGIWYFESKINEWWLHVNTYLGGFNAIVRDSTNIFYAAKPFQGIFKSTNEGITWEKVSFSDELVKPMIAAAKNGLVFAAGKNSGISRSTDYGRNWSAASETSRTFYCMAFDSSNNIYAGTSGGLYRSVNGGNTWTYTSPSSLKSVSVAVAPNGNIYYVNVLPGGEKTPPTFNTYRSTNSGGSWQSVKSDEGSNMVAVNKNGDVYVVGWGSKACRSTDNGVSWTQVEPANASINSVAFNSSGNVILGAIEGVFFSINNGLSWTKYTLNFPDGFYPYSTSVVVNRQNYIFAACEDSKGIYYSKNNGSTWDSLNASFTVGNVKSISRSPEGDIYFYTNAPHKAFDPSSMKAPTMLYVSNDSARLPLKPAFGWNKETRAELYQLEICDDKNFTYPNEAITQSTTTHTIYRQLDYGTTYYWHVRSKTHSAVSPWSAAWQFTTLIAPPLLLSPVNDTAGVPVLAQLVWLQPKGASYYRVQLASDTGFTKIIMDSTNITGLNIFTPKLDYYKKYYWRVMALAPKNWSDWSEIRSFTTIIAPPKLRLPPDKSMDLDRSITFFWDTTAGGVNYEIEIASDSIYQAVIFKGETETDTSHKINLLEYNTRYFWHIRSRYKYGTSDWSESWNFTTAIEGVQLRLPQDSSKNLAVSLKFEWEKFKDAVQYHLQIAEDTDFKTIFFDDSTIITETKQVPGFNYSTRYFWRAKAKVSGRFGNWSDIWTFKTQMSGVILDNPSNDSADVANNTFLYWHPTFGAKSYKAQLAKDSSFVLIVFNKDNITDTLTDATSLLYNTKYFWRVKAINEDGETNWSEIRSFITIPDPNGVEWQNDNKFKSVDVFPNPFGRSINISFFSTQTELFSITAFDQSGRKIALIFNGWVPEGKSEIVWNPENLSNGRYFIKIETGGGNRVISVEYSK
ncbi:MAG: type sorting protein [Bacteroidota bacterium]|nr:type sorting protein [Bacteroidota bacterium]